MRQYIVSVTIAILLVALTAPARASTVSYLDIISSSSIGSGTLGTVTLTQNGADEVDLQVSLAANTKFVSTGGPHNAFAFNLDLLTPYTVTVNSPSTGFSSVGGSVSDTPYGTFTTGVDCPACGPGASHAKGGPLDLSVTDVSGITIDDFVSNASQYLFSADVIGPDGGTGNIAADSLSSVPLPAALPLFAISLTLLGLLGASRRRLIFLARQR
jgi:hypothetical protein